MSAIHPTAPADAYTPVPLLQGKVIVISGVGPGLGHALATEAARMGATLILAARTEQRLKHLAEEIRQLGAEATTITADITDEQQRTHLAEHALHAYGRIDCLINNAFAIPPMHPITQIELDDLRKVNETNVFAPLRLSTLFADALETTRGSIIMLNSCVAYSSQPEYSGYKLSKGTLAHLASSLATELGPRGIRVNSIAPSYVYEDINKAYFDWLAGQAGVDHAEIYRRKAEPTDLKRLAGPEEVARATLFLASDLATAITGQMLTVDCGEFHR
ncbi:SDR family oxidoreductase [Nocardia sp. NPDC127579]|uniref:SDR family oxidoreductase n=1 Tax=Nocardia sp. NPDC127579 TaxID=3345402 RepID=UPI00362E78CA